MIEGYCSLAELCETEITDGTHQTPVYSEQGYIFLSSKDVTGGVIDWEHVKHIPENLHKELYARVKPQVDDILLAKNGTTGIAALVDRDEVFDIYVSLALIRPDKSKVIPQYLLYAINSQKTQEFFKRNLKGIGVPNLHLTHIRETPIKLHPKAVQKEIIEKLGCIDCLLKEYEEELDILETLVKSRFVEMFGNPVTNPMGWETGTLKELTSKIGSGATPKGGNASYKDEGITLIRSMNVYNGYFDYDGLAHIDDKQAALLDNVSVESGDVLLNITGASVARCCIVPNNILPARVNQHVCILRCKKIISPLFLNTVLISDQYQAKLWNLAEAGATRQALSKEKIETFSIIMPPITLQNQFADFVALTDKSKIAIQRSIRLLELLKASLMQTYFG